MKYVLIGMLKAYRLVVSPLYGNVCRYYPSCSAYALRAVQVHGAVRGTWLAGRRLLRCHPWTPGGYDPVPGTPEFAAEMREQADRAVTMDTRDLDTRDLDTPDLDVIVPDPASGGSNRAADRHVRGANCSN